jgi:hypothetical protein
MRKISTLTWVPGCLVHRPGTFSYHHFVVVLHVDLITLEILTYSLQFKEGCDDISKPSLINTLNPYGFWLWQADQCDLNRHTASVLASPRLARGDFDSFGPLRVIRKFPSAKLGLLANRLMKSFYDLNASHLGHLYSPIRTSNNLLLQRINRSVEYANGFCTTQG